jgi:LysM repeat protein
MNAIGMSNQNNPSHHFHKPSNPPIKPAPVTKKYMADTGMTLSLISKRKKKTVNA